MSFINNIKNLAAAFSPVKSDIQFPGWDSSRKGTFNIGRNKLKRVRTLLKAKKQQEIRRMKHQLGRKLAPKEYKEAGNAKVA
jgi:hypothetical protein